MSDFAEVDRTRYGQGVASITDKRLQLRPELVEAYRAGAAFTAAVDDLLDTSRDLVSTRYSLNSPFTPGRQYSRKETTRLLTMPRKWTSTLYGYRVDAASNSCPIFVTMHKSDEVAASTAYEERLLDRHTLLWSTRSRRTIEHNEVQAILSNKLDLHVFVKKDDADGGNFYYLGQATASDPVQSTMPASNGEPLNVVHMLLRFADPIESALFDYFHPEITIGGG